jgi:hypothetical protein
MSQGATEEKNGWGRGIGAPPVAGLARLVGLYLFSFILLFLIFD